MPDPHAAPQAKTCAEVRRAPANSASFANTALARENDLAYMAPSGRYWEHLDRFEPEKLAEIDALWRTAWDKKSVVVT